MYEKQMESELTKMDSPCEIQTRLSLASK